MLQRFVLLMAFTGCCNVFAQQVKTYTYDSLDKKRVHINTIGMAHLGAWGAVNVIGGGVGYFTSTDREWKSFYGMNVIWGATNALIAYAGYKGAVREADKHPAMYDAMHSHERVKILYLINAGLDVLYIGSGAVVNAYANDMDNSAMWHGFGKSFMVQGAVLLLFDGTMYALHSSQNKKWYKLLQGVTVTGDGVGYRYQF